MGGSLEEIRDRAGKLLRRHEIMGRAVRVKAHVLSTEEAIGDPEGDDFPLQKGKERLMQAELDGSLGQAFTDQYGDFQGTLEEIFEMPFTNNYRRAVFVSALNAALRSVGLASRTIHCRNEGPDLCAQELARVFLEKGNQMRIGQVGFQPCMVEALGTALPLRVLDLDRDNIGTEKRGVFIEGPEARDEVIDWADLLLVTGTTLVNNTIEGFLGTKPTVFYGTTVSGAAAIMGWERFCGQGS